jgi:type II secretory pathway pseudopilin PulG
MKDGRGFTYIGLLVAIAIIGIMTTVVAQTWKTASRVEKEKELLWRGRQFRHAIKTYYEFGRIHNNPSYPSELKDLMKDPRTIGMHRYIRKVYADPMTGKDDWVAVLVNDRIVGVHSSSDDAPLKRDGFDAEDADFRGKGRYSDWTFVYIAPGTAPAQPAQPQEGVNPHAAGG